MNVRIRPIADIQPIADAMDMRCFYVLVHGQLNWKTEPSSTNGHPQANRPLGFYCHRYALAPNEDEAKGAAFRRVLQNLDKQTGWISAGTATVDLDAEEATAFLVR